LSTTVFLIVLAAAALHAGWNAIVKIKLDPFLAMTLICTASGVLALPALAITGLPRAEAWPWIALSITIHLFYYLFLAEAYRRADMGQVYPVARGTAPLITAVLSITLVHDPVTAGDLAGIAILGLGILLISLRGHRRLSPPSGIAMICALLTAVSISAYTLVDGLGARAAGDANAYAAALFTFDAYPMLLLCLWRGGLAGIRPALGFVLPGLAGGAMSLAAYWIVIWAMTVAPIALVAATRESSVLFAGAIALVVLKEPLTPIRAISAALIVAGLAAMRLW
jgi:drug/metabolite transporter (DMT)-like permease